MHMEVELPKEAERSASGMRARSPQGELRKYRRERNHNERHAGHTHSVGVSNLARRMPIASRVP
jgi:hypothetical protein